MNTETTAVTVTPAPETPYVMSPELSRAWDLALEIIEPREDDFSASIVGAANDYNARGRGSTMARRVLRKGAWEWVSAPASRGRVRADDRHNKTYGDVFEGEIVAEYTLGLAKPKPEAFYIVRASNTKPCLVNLEFTKTRSGYKLRGAKSGKEIVVSDPTWK